MAEDIWECSNCGTYYRREGICIPCGKELGEPLKTRKVGFAIQNNMCRHFSEPLDCVEDPSNIHTCCQEECPNVVLMLSGIKERHMELAKEKT